MSFEENDLTFEHVAKQLFHRSVSYRSTEEQTSDSVAGNIAQRWQHQKKSSEPAQKTENLQKRNAN